MDVFKQLKSFYWVEKKFLLSSILCLMAATALGLVYPNLLRILIDDVIMKGKFELVPAISLSVVGVIALKSSLQFLHGFFGGRLGNRVAYRLRNACYDKLQYLSFKYYDNAKTGDLMSRLTADLEALRNFIGFGFAQILNMVLMIIFGGAMMLSIHWQLTLLTLVTIPFLTYSAFRLERSIHPAFREMRLAMSRLTTAVQENITGVRTVKSFARETHEVHKFGQKSTDYRENQLGVSRIWGHYFPIMELLANFGAVILLVAGGMLVIRDSLSIGEFVAFFSLTWYIIGPMWGIGFHINNYTQSKASGERMLELLNEYVHIKNTEHPVVLSPESMKGHVRYEDVTFGYGDGASALTHFSLDAAPGKVIGLLGGTGSGKSTVIQLLMRAYDVKKGKVTIDGIDVRELDIESLRSAIAPVFQETFLFSASIRDNIAYGAKDATMEQIINAAKLAKAHDFIMELPLGYDTVVGERGMGLSGGQKQRISIARALIRNPRILILDDATSAVDMETEHEIQAGFRELMAGRTTFVIAHRISSLRQADEIIVLDQGRIVQRGTHEQLLAVGGPYRDVYRIQYADRPDGSADDASDAWVPGEPERPAQIPGGREPRREAVPLSSQQHQDAASAQAEAKQGANKPRRERFIYQDDELIEKPFNWKQLGRLFAYLKPYRKQLLPVILVGMVLGTLTRLAIPTIVIMSIDEAINPKEGEPSVPKLLLFAALMLVLYIIQWASNRYRIKNTNIIGQRVIHDLRSHLFSHIQTLSFRFFDKRPAGSVLVRVTNDVNALQDLFTNGVVNLLMDCVQLAGIVIILLIWNFKLGLAVMLTVPLMFLVSSALRKRIRFAWQDVRIKQSRINSHLNESIQGIKVTQAYVQEKENIKFFEGMNLSNIRSWNKASAMNQSFGPIIELTSAVGTLILFWYGSYLIQHEMLTVGMLVGFANYIGNFWEPINRLGQMYSQLLIAMASSERIFEYLDERPVVGELPEANKLGTVRGDVKFDNLVFEYEPGRPALKGVTIEAKAGQSVALVGHTGSGKSTIMNLLCRFYDPVEGRVLIDGTDIRSVSLESLRSQIGIVLQDTFIFSGTIRDNIRFGKLNATDEEIVAAAKAVHAHEFIMGLPDGYDTEVQERGNVLSMGQRQLLSFARALLADPRILILDEATASIDTETELKIQKALQTLLQGRTSFIVAHRLSTIRHADSIIVLDHGSIVEQGSHDELMAVRGTYHGLIEAQYRFLSA